MTAVFSPFAIAAAFQATFTPVTTTVVYEAVTIFLMLTSFFLANYVTELPQERMRRIMRAYTVDRGDLGDRRNARLSRT